MFPVLQIGPLALRTEVIFILLGIYLGLEIAVRRLPKDSLTPNQLYTLLILTAISGVFAARISFIFENFSFFQNSPKNIFSIEPNLLDPYTGTLFAVIAAMVTMKRFKLDLWITLDAYTPFIAILAIFLGLAHTASGKAFGMATSLPWGVELWGTLRHPSQLYETIASLIILAVFWTNFGKSKPPGSSFLKFILASSAIRLFLEAWRGDSEILIGGLRQTQLICLTIIACAGILYEIKIAREKPALPPA